LESINRLIYKLVDWVKHLGGVALVGMMTITTIDVITRYFGHPIFGAVELISFMATILLACAMPMTHVENGHVGVDLVVRLLGRRTQALIDAITGFLSLILFTLICWQCVLYAQSMKKTGEVSMSLEFPSYIFVYVVAMAFGVLGLAVIPQLSNNLRTIFGEK
jgi:TRAP-type C4-dicarboxylate transport system permease small subunit